MDMAHVLSEVLGKPVDIQQIIGEACKASPTGSGVSDTMAQGIPDLLTSKYDGLDKAAPRTPHSSTPTTIRRSCDEVFQPVVRASALEWKRSVCRRP